MKYPRRRRVVRKPKVNRRRRVYRRAKNARGYVLAKRKLPLITIGSGGAGIPVLNDAGLGTCVTLGTPAASLGLPAGYYDVPFSIQCAFNQQTNSGEFTNLFDRYRIKHFSVRVSNNANVSTTQTGGNLPYIEYCTDSDDNVPPGASIFREKMGIKTKYFSSSKIAIVMSMTPKPAQTMYNTALLSGYAVPTKAPFINSTYDAIPHYGIKGVIRHMWLSGGANQNQLTLDATLTHECKDIQ